MENIDPVSKKEKPVIAAPKPAFDASVLNETVKFHQMQVDRGKDMKPDDVLKIDTRLREGSEHKDDVLTIDGVQIFLPQLSVVEYRKATLAALRTISSTSLARKLVNSFRSKASDEELDRELPTDEAIDLATFNLELDTRLVWLTLRKSNHPKISGDYEKDKAFVENIPQFFEIAKRVGQTNATNEQGVDNVKFFRNDELRGQTASGVEGNKLSAVQRTNPSPK